MSRQSSYAASVKSITVGELRQNPTAMLADVAAGETYRITRHDREVGRVVPPAPGVEIVPAKHRGGVRLPDLPADYAAPSPQDLEAILHDERADR